MAKAAITEQYLTDIADAIRTKTGQSTATYYPSLMAPAILTISGSGGITPTGTININTNGTHNVTNYASANVSVPNSYATGDEGKVVSNGTLVSQTNATYTSNNTYDTTLINSVTVNVSGSGTEAISVVDTTDPGAGGTIRTITAVDISDTTATASDVASGKYFYTANGTKTAGTGSSGIDLSWLAASTPTPSVRNFFAALINGNYEHGEFTLSSQPSDTFVDLFTMTNFSATTPPQGILFIDKDFYQGITGLSQNANEYCAFTWLDKAFINPASDTDLTVPKYATLRVMANQSGTSIGNMATTNFTIFDGTTQAMRAFWQFDGNKCQCKFYYNNQNQYTPFLRGRTYIWIVY